MKVQLHVVLCVNPPPVTLTWVTGAMGCSQRGGRGTSMESVAGTTVSRAGAQSLSWDHREE